MDSDDTTNFDHFLFDFLAGDETQEDTLEELRDRDDEFFEFLSTISEIAEEEALAHIGAFTLVPYEISKSVFSYFKTLYESDPLRYKREYDLLSTQPDSWIEQHSEFAFEDFGFETAEKKMRLYELAPFSEQSCITYEELCAMADNCTTTQRINLLGVACMKLFEQRPHIAKQTLPPRNKYSIDAKKRLPASNYFATQDPIYRITTKIVRRRAHNEEDYKESVSLVTNLLEDPLAEEKREQEHYAKFEEEFTALGALVEERIRDTQEQEVDILSLLADESSGLMSILSQIPFLQSITPATACDFIHMLYTSGEIEAQENIRIHINQNILLRYSMPSQLEEILRDDSAYFKITSFMRAFNELASRYVISPSANLPITHRCYSIPSVHAFVQYDDCCILYIASSNDPTFEEKGKDLKLGSVVDALLFNDVLRKHSFFYERYDWFKDYVRGKGIGDEFSEILNSIDGAPRCWYTNSSFRNFIEGWNLRRLDLDTVFWMPVTHDVATLLDDPAFGASEELIQQLFSFDYALAHSTLTQEQARKVHEWYQEEGATSKEFLRCFENPPREAQEQFFANRILRHITIIKDRLGELEKADSEHKEYIQRVVPSRVERLQDLVQGTRFENLIREELTRLNL